jgi:uncharacterized protein DUF2188
MVWFLHITERKDGRWACTHGRHHLDHHEELADAIEHLRDYAKSMTGAVQLLVHRADGQLERFGDLNPEG